MGPIDSEKDVEDHQNDLNTIYNWQQENNMLFNGNKFELLMKKSRNQPSTLHLKYVIQ